MKPTPQWSFPPFRLDPLNACLWQDTTAIHLSPKIFAVLQCLVQHATQLVTKDTFFATVWPGTTVSEAVLKVAIQTIRRVLGDAAKTPQFIATVRGRGYRFMAPVTLLTPASAASSSVAWRQRARRWPEGKSPGDQVVGRASARQDRLARAYSHSAPACCTRRPHHSGPSCT